jgi:AICAR transformylase/IMP cyclohydrolase PurH
MKSEDKKAAMTTYKERKVAAGIYALRCVPTGQRWVGRAPDLSTIQNRLSFTLRQGSNPHQTLQAAWSEHGAEKFTFEEIERLDDEALAYIRDRNLKDRLAHWCAELDAEAI